MSASISTPLSIFAAGRIVIVLPQVVGTAWYWMDEDDDEYYDEDDVEPGYMKWLAVYHSAPASDDDNFILCEEDGLRFLAQLSMYFEIVEGNRKP